MLSYFKSPQGQLVKANLFLKLFALTKVPLIACCRPKLITLNEKSCTMKMKLGFMTKNHLNSMYFGALAIGADLAGGFLAYQTIQASKRNVALVFKDIQGNFLKRATGHCLFICDDGILAKNLVNKAIETKQRVEELVTIKVVSEKNPDELIAEFKLTLSLKLKEKRA